MIVTVVDPLDLSAVVHHFVQRVDQFTRRGSGYTLERIIQLSATCIKFRPLDAAGSYIPTPAWIKHKRAVLMLKTRATTDVSSGLCSQNYFPHASTLTVVRIIRNMKNIWTTTVSSSTDGKRHCQVRSSESTIVIHCLPTRTAWYSGSKRPICMPTWLTW